MLRLPIITLLALGLLSSSSIQSVATEPKTSILAPAWNCADAFRSLVKLADFKNLPQLDALKNPHVLVGTIEFGKIELSGRDVTARVGGVGTVIQDWVSTYPAWAQKNHQAKVSFVLMGMDGVPRGEKFAEFKLPGDQVPIQAYKEPHPSGGDIYVLDHPLFWRYSIRDPKRNLYTRGWQNQAITGQGHWDDFYISSIYNRAIAELHKMIDANIYHANDTKTAMAAYYLGHDTSAVSYSIHNMEPGYADQIYLRPDQVDHFLNLMQISREDFDRFFRTTNPEPSADSVILDTGRIYQYISKFNLLGGHPVSIGYANELGHPGLVGVPNGLNPEVHASRHPLLGNLQFGHEHDIDQEAGRNRIIRNKQLLKASLQEELGLERNGDAPVFVVLSRWARQKDLEIFARTIDFIVKRGGQVVVGGPVVDDEGRLAANIVDEYERQYPKHVRRLDGYVQGRLNVLVRAGGDFEVSTARFEPFGLTGPEAAWLGTLFIARKTGGIGESQVPLGFYYEWNNKEDRREVYELRRVIDHAITVFRQYASEILRRRISGLQQDYRWERSYSQFFNYYQANAAFRWLQQLEYRGVTDPDLIGQWIEQLPLPVQAALYQGLASRSELTLVQQGVLQRTR